ncbi:MAG: 1-acyl-sn-glycerol-3-phosphate acyltransferase [Candidatus Hydrogenedentes bacterium]|nr:1-acyl-sn-glycerol-3-phosphate acyltransferase [Candidatus Hydrogenedentota bacterium]
MEPWEYDSAQDIDRNVIERLRQFPREPDMLVYGARLAAMLLLRTGLRLYHRFKILGRENLPREGSFVLVANHASHLDVMCLISAFPLRKVHRVFPAAAQDYFFVSVPRLAIAAIVVNALPFDRQVSIRHSLGLCQRLLENPGNVLVIFPEGTRSISGELCEFKPGIGLLVAGKDVPVVPCYLEGAHRAWGKGHRLPKPHRVRLTIGAARNYSQLKPGKESALHIAEDLRSAVLALASSAEASKKI